MSTVWKDVWATIGLLVTAGIVVAMMAGFAADFDARWAVASFVVFVVAGITGLITGTKPLMKRTWSEVTLYALFLAMLAITITNAFLNSEAWLVALGINVSLLWVEYVGVSLFTHDTSTHGPRTTHLPGTL